jgi:hypothetical protein
VCCTSGSICIGGIQWYDICLWSNGCWKGKKKKEEEATITITSKEKRRRRIR